MKKTRFIAGLLCIMMVLTMVPMMASATVADSLYDQIGGLMGRNSSRAVDNETWLSMNFDFTDNFSQTDSITLPEGAFYDNTNGLNMPKGTYSTWKYFPSTLTSQGWTPLVFGAYYLRFKLDEAGKLEAQACAYYNDARSFIIMSPTGVTVFTSSDNATIGSGMGSVTNLVDYAPGTDWNDMVVVANGGSANSANGYSVYMKKDTDTEFTKVASTGSYRSNGNWKGTGLTLSGNDSYVSDAVMLEGSDEKLNIPTVEVTGGSPVATDFNAAGAALGAASIKPTAAAVSNGAVFDFPKNAGQESYEGAKIDAGSVIYDEYGMNLGSADSVWRYQPSTPWCAFNYGSMIYTRVKVAEGGSVLGKFYQPTSIHGFVKFDLTPSAISFSDAEGKETNAAECTPGSSWVEIILDRKSLTEMVWYVRGGSLTEWTQMATSTTWISGSNNVGITFAGKNATVNYCAVVETSDVAQTVPSVPEPDDSGVPNPGVTYDLAKAVGKILGSSYAVPAEASADWPTTNLVFDENFDATQDGITSPEGVTYNENGINFPASFVTWKYRPTCNYNGWSPLCISGNYTFGFRLKEGGTLENQAAKVWNDARAFIIFNNDGVTVFNGGENDGDGQAVTENLVDYKPGTDWNDVMVVADSTGGYDVYMKKASDKEFTHVASAPTYRKGSAWNSTGFQLDGANAYVNYGISYVPASDIVVTDKNGIDVTSGQEEQLDLSSLTATILPNPDEARVLFFAIYGENGNLIDIKKHDIPAGTTTSTIHCNPFEKSDKIRKIKAFLWSDTNNIVSISNVIEMKGNVYTLEDDWTFGGSTKVEENRIYLTAASNSEAYAEYETEIGSQFDISWEMEVEAFSGQENVQIYTGSNCYLLAVAENGITYNTNSGTKTIPWVIGNGKHKYRLFGSNGSGSLFIDGFFVGDLIDTETSSEKEKIRFWNKGGSVVEFAAVQFNEYSESNIPSKGFYDEFENGDLCGWSNAGTQFSVTNTFTKQWVNSKNGNLVVEDYHLAQSPNACVTSSSRAISEVGDEFVLQAKILFSSWGTESYMVTEVGGKQLKLDFREKYFSVGVDKGYSTEISDEFLLGTTEYHLITIESYNHMNNARIYLNGTLIQDTPLATATDGLNRICFQANGGWYLPATMEVDYIKYSPKYYSLDLTSPAENSVYYVGDAIQLSASEKVKFKLNGVVVANGTSATLENLPAGRYHLVAESGNKMSREVRFLVKERASAIIQASQSGNAVTVSLGTVSGFESVAKVTYLLDGKEVGVLRSAPYQTAISNISAENHMLEAIAYNASGIEVGRFTKELPAVISGNTTTSFSNEVSYSVAGDGTAIVENGTHKLQMNHTSTAVKYLTNTGEKTYNKGNGNFKIITDGPYAEVYRNGQYVFGFCMPKSTEVKTSFSGGVSNGTVVVPGEKKSYFAARNLNVQNAVYPLGGLTHNHNLDFVASPEDEVSLVINDGYYRNNIALKNGKIYVWEAEKNNSVPKEKEVKKMAKGEVYYRVETVAGMSRLYADGKWIYTFRNGVVSGRKGVLAVNVTAGDGLSYLNVNQSKDLYYHNDTFDQSGEFNSADYWMTSNQLTATQNNEDLLLTSTSQKGIAELSSSVGDATLTSHLTVTPGTEGFWFVANHAVTDSYTKAGYNFNTGQFEIIDVINGSEVAKVTQSGTLSAGVRVLMKLVVEETLNGKVVSLYVDGNKVISKNDSLQARGRLGFMVANGKASLGYVVYRGDAKPMPDMRDNPIFDGFRTLDMIETEDKTYLFNSMYGAYTTTDGGKTWEKFEVKAGQGLSTQTGVGVTENMVRLQNGELISMVPVVPPSWWDEYGVRRGQIRPYVSKDDGMNWSHVGTQPFPPEVSAETLDSLPLQGRGATVNAISQGPSGRVYFVYGGGNSEDYGFSEVWMSDDNGRSWFKSMTEIDAVQTGYVIAEAKVIETTQNTRFYFRTDKGQICYFESYDYGETWDMIPHSTPFISSMTCFSVEADPEDPDTLYIGWGYDTINLYARPQFSRTRWAVARSTDAGQNWEMVGTVHENNSVEHNMMNLNINVSKDYVYLNAFSSDNYGATLPWSSRIVSFPKDKQRTSPRLEQIHIMYPSQIENAVILPKEEEELTLAVYPDTESVVLREQLIQNGAEGEYISLEIAAAFVGAAVEEDGSASATLTLGDATVTFNSPAVKSVNGKMYLSVDAFADKFGMTVIKEKGMLLIGEKSDWSQRQKNALRYATDLFSMMP